MLAHRSRRFLAAVPALLACSSACEGGSLELTATADGRFASSADPVNITVTAVNDGTERVVWGRGSSTCQLGLVVTVEGVRRRALEDRVCTSDLVEQGLDPGESRSEVLPWTGYAMVGDAIGRLPPGSYVLFGAAGMTAVSRAGVITLTEGAGVSNTAQLARSGR